MVTKLDICLEDVIKSTKNKILILTTLAAITLLPNGLFGNVQKKFDKQLDRIKIEQSYIEKGKEYLKKAKGRINSDEQVAIYNKALVEFYKAMRFEDECTATQLIGKTHLEAGYYKGAIESLEEALKCIKKDDKEKMQEILLDLSDAYRNANNYKKAEEYAKRVLKLDEKSHKAYNKIGLIEFKKGNYNEAAKYFEKAVLLNPDYASGMACLAHTYSNLGKHNDAMQMINKALEREPDVPSFNWIKGLIYFNQGKVYEGTGWMRRAIELAPYADNWKEELKKIESESNCK